MKNKEILKTTLFKKGDNILGINVFKIKSDYIQNFIILTIYPISFTVIYIYPLEVLSFKIRLFTKLLPIPPINLSKSNSTMGCCIMSNSGGIITIS